MGLEQAGIDAAFRYNACCWSECDSAKESASMGASPSTPSATTCRDHPLSAAWPSRLYTAASLSAWQRAAIHSRLPRVRGVLAASTTPTPPSAGADTARRSHIQSGARPGWLLYGFFGAGAVVLGASTWYGVQLSKTPKQLPAHLQAVAAAAEAKRPTAAADGLEVHPAFQRLPGEQRSIGGLAVRGVSWDVSWRVRIWCLTWLVAGTGVLVWLRT